MDNTGTPVSGYLVSFNLAGMLGSHIKNQVQVGLPGHKGFPQPGVLSMRQRFFGDVPVGKFASARIDQPTGGVADAVKHLTAAVSLLHEGHSADVEVPERGSWVVQTYGGESPMRIAGMLNDMPDAVRAAIDAARAVSELTLAG